MTFRELVTWLFPRYEGQRTVTPLFHLAQHDLDEQRLMQEVRVRLETVGRDLKALVGDGDSLKETGHVKPRKL